MNGEQIQIGDEVEYYSGGSHFVVCDYSLGTIIGFNARGDMFCAKNPLRWRKTGRHFPELPALLEKMKEVKSNDS